MALYVCTDLPKHRGSSAAAVAPSRSLVCAMSERNIDLLVSREE